MTFDEIIAFIIDFNRESFWHIPGMAEDIQSKIDLLTEEDPRLLDAQGKRGHALLTASAYAQNVPLLRHLLQKGADIDAQNRNGETALFITAYKGNLEGAQVLRLWNPDPNIPNTQQRTALHLPANHGDTDMVRLLIEIGADAEAMDAQGMTPLHMVRSAAGLLDVRNGTLPDDPVEMLLKNAKEIRAKALSRPIGTAEKPVRLAAPLRLKCRKKSF